MIPNNKGGLSRQAMAAPPAANTHEIENLAEQHKLKLKPPTYDGNYSTFEE